MDSRSKTSPEEVATIDINAHVVLTGASSGLGAALARQYASPSRSLTLLGRDAVRLEAVAEDCRLRGAVAKPVVADVRDRAAMASAMRAADDWMAVTHVIANAGLGGGAALASAVGETSDMAADLVATNISGVLHTVLPLLPRMVSRDGGQITLIGSLAGAMGLPQSPVYCATKAAVHVYGEGLRRQLRGTSIGVTVVAPGFVDTPMSRSLPFSVPGAWDDVRAAKAIVRGVDRRRAMLAFPWSVALALRACAALPRSISDPLVAMASSLVSEQRR